MSARQEEEQTEEGYDSQGFGRVSHRTPFPFVAVTHRLVLHSCCLWYIVGLMVFLLVIVIT